MHETLKEAVEVKGEVTEVNSVQFIKSTDSEELTEESLDEVVCVF